MAKDVTKNLKGKYPEIQGIKEDLGSLKDNTVELAQHVKKDGLNQVEETAKSLKSFGQKELKKAEKYVKQKPMQSIAIAFAGGVVASILLRGRR